MPNLQVLCLFVFLVLLSFRFFKASCLRTRIILTACVSTCFWLVAVRGNLTYRGFSVTILSFPICQANGQWLVISYPVACQAVLFMFEPLRKSKETKRMLFPCPSFYIMPWLLQFSISIWSFWVVVWYPIRERPVSTSECFNLTVTWADQ